MKLIDTKIKGLQIIKSEIFNDKRGFLRETYRKNLLKNQDFPFDILSFSKRNVLRGLHIQTKNPQAKIITVTHGQILDVAVDLRRKSKTFGKHYKIILSQKNATSIYIPPGFAHGFLTLDKENIVLYGCTNYRNKESETSIAWNDKDLKIKWPIKKPILSTKDSNNKSFKELNLKN